MILQNAVGDLSEANGEALDGYWYENSVCLNVICSDRIAAEENSQFAAVCRKIERVSVFETVRRHKKRMRRFQVFF